MTPAKKKLLWVGSGPPRNCSGQVGLAKTASGRILTQPIPMQHMIIAVHTELLLIKH